MAFFDKDDLLTISAPELGALILGRSLQWAIMSCHRKQTLDVLEDVINHVYYWPYPVTNLPVLNEDYVNLSTMVANDFLDNVAFMSEVHLESGNPRLPNFNRSTAITLFGKLQDSIVPTSTLLTFELLELDSPGKFECYLDVGLELFAKFELEISDAEAAHLAKNLCGAPFVMRKCEAGYNLDMVRKEKSIGSQIKVIEDVWIFDRNDTDPGLTTSAAEWELLDSIWSQYARAQEELEEESSEVSIREVVDERE